MATDNREPRVLALLWQKQFIQVIRHHDMATPLRESAIRGSLRAWTQTMTTSVVHACMGLGWHTSAHGHTLDLLPVTPSEYLALDVTAFSGGDGRWRFPIGVFELENGGDDRIAYSLWKVLCVQTALRAVICYRKRSEDGALLARFLRDDVISTMSIAERTRLNGETLLIIGSRSVVETFPFGFFKWWRLDTNRGLFELLR